jgi:outer membrane scaffolding protein for murein synthesis (MipA/OmpV family)
LRARNIAIPALCALFSSAGAAHAEGWIVTAGARFRIKPPYEGAEAHVISVLPTLAIRRADRPYRFTPPDGAATLGLIDTNWIVAGPVLRFRGSRSDTGEFAGLNRIGVAAEPGAFVDLWPAKWLRARVEARRGVSGHYGWVGDAGLDAVYTGARWDASIGPRFGYGDARYMQTYFGLTPLEAALRHEAAYTPGSGLRYTGGAVAAAYHLDKHWKVNFDLTYNRLASKALASPVVRAAGAGDQLSAGVGFSYTFGH